jgi:radical S-adenosyl methionine domain-containing protein 2
MCYEHNIKFKLNTVVCRYNFMEDMNDFIARLQPFRWKCFQVLIVKTENDGDSTSIRNAQAFTITDDEYELFCQRHQKQDSFIKESNSIMRSSYLILDEYMRFLDKGDKNEYVMSGSILDVDVDTALKQINWDDDSFQKRNGQYDWTKEFSSLECSSDKNLEW